VSVVSCSSVHLFMRASLDSQYGTVLLQTRLMHQHIDTCVERLQYSHYNAYMGLRIVVNSESHEGNSTSSVCTASAVQ